MIGRMQDIAAGVAGLMGVALVTYFAIVLGLQVMAKLLAASGL